jgi:hypothetical protein
MKKLDRIDPKVLASNPRASYAAWMKYEPIVIAAFRQHPKTFVYSPTSMTPSSVASKMRDAVRGMLAFAYPCPIPVLDLANWYNEIIIKHDKEAVYIGVPEKVKSVIRGEQRSPDSASNLIFPTLTFEEVSAFTLLLSTARILGPILIQNPPDLSLLPKRPNVEMMVRNDGSLVLL